YWLLIAGFATALLSAWLALSAETTDEQWPRILQAPALSVILLVFLLALSFRLSAGFGAAAALVAGWAVAAAMLGFRSNAGRLPLQMLAIGANFLLLRLFLERSGFDFGEIDISLHYTLMGILLGMILPFVFSSLYLRQGLARVLLVGLPSALSPLLILAFWGPDAALGLLVGLVAAQAFSLLLSLISQQNPLSAAWQAPVGLISLGMALVAVQYSHPLVFLYELSRAQKAHLAGAVALLAVLWVFVLGLVKLRTRAREILASRNAVQEEAK
ncbi:MAG: hypothetical protein GTN69_04810, partial [Armatimonadetes bacterium]|nr:hypothetical protein [Armatimonadota bacterium]NIO75205.1 hypothetical protein [Armatimonadota bacterium]NIO98603.1 hypothetical protein [Armatimonadota bacterium]